MNRHLNLIVFVFIIIISSNAFAKAPRWYTYYYLNPNPDKFIEETKKMSHTGILSDPKTSLASTTFLSQVMAQNPDKINDWLNALNESPEVEMAPFFKAAWLSNTREAKHYFEKNHITEYNNRHPSDPLSCNLNHPAQLDMLWSYFFATGKEEPIRRIVTTFEYYKYKGAIDSYKNSEQTLVDRQKAIYEAMFKSALWSLESNSKQHVAVKKHMENIFHNDPLSENERLWLVFILNRLEPEKYKIQVHETPWH